MHFATFRGCSWPTLGVELELQLIDAHSLALTGAIGEILSDVPATLRESIKPEFHNCCVEINTGVCHDVAEVEQDLSAKLAATSRIVGDHGVLLGWGGTHPFSHWRDQPIVPAPRYRQLVEQYQESLCRQLTFGLHVHVGVGGGDAAVRACNRITAHLPALLALSANSPFWCGHATGLHSNRVEVTSVSPTGGLPPRFSCWDDYTNLVARLIATGLIQTPKELWWDVRPSPALGTVEVRICDMPSNLIEVLGLTALIQCLVVDLSQGGGEPANDECDLMIIRQNRWRATRYGLEATLIDHRSGVKAPARETIQNMIVRLGDVAAALGCSQYLAQAREMTKVASGAERQLADFDRTGDLLDVARRQLNGFGTPPALNGPAPSLVSACEARCDPWLRLVTR